MSNITEPCTRQPRSLRLGLILLLICSTFFMGCQSLVSAPQPVAARSQLGADSFADQTEKVVDAEDVLTVLLALTVVGLLVILVADDRPRRRGRRRGRRARRVYEVRHCHQHYYDCHCR